MTQPAIKYPAGRSRVSQSPAPNDTQSADFALVAPPDAKAERQRVNREAAEQVEFMHRVRGRLDPDTGRALPGSPGADMIFALANENAAGRGVGVLRWKMGVRAGLPDLGVFVPRVFRGRQWHGAFVEFKQSSGTACDVRPGQRECLEMLSRSGYLAVVAYGWHDGWNFLCEYLGWGDVSGGGMYPRRTAGEQIVPPQ